MKPFQSLNHCPQAKAEHVYRKNNGKRDTGSDKGGSEGGDKGSRSSKNKESSCAMWGEVILIQSVYEFFFLINLRSISFFLNQHMLWKSKAEGEEGR